MSEMSDTFKLVNAMKLAKTAQVGLGMAYFDVIELLGELELLKDYIAELETRLESCESALVSMVYQFFYQPELGVLAHSFMSAEEEACEYLIKYGIAHWSNERKNSIVFDEVQELPKESEE